MIVVVFLSALFLLTVYSYSQVDLNLTLLQTQWFLTFRDFMVQLGYFNRPLSTTIFFALAIALFALYVILLRRPPKSPWPLVIGIAAVTLLAYPAFSHDFFNYLFDARIVTHYGQNPYLFKALDFPADPWIRFMHWTHRTYPYGPVWLALTLPFSWLGLDKFILTAINFKLLFAGAYLGSVYLIKKIAGSKSALFFAANPLVIIEGLVSSHVDVVMAAIFLLAVFFSNQKKRLLAIVSTILSGGTKFITLVCLPLFFVKLETRKFLIVSLGLLLFALVPVILTREVYPWYFLPAVAIASLLIDNKKILALTLALSLGLILRYVPYLYLGKEDLLPQDILTIAPILLCVFSLPFWPRR